MPSVFVVSVHEQAKKREEVLNRAKQIQQDKEQKNQLRVSDNQSKTGTAQKKAPGNVFNTSSTFNNSMNDSTNLGKTTTTTNQIAAPKAVVLDMTSNKLLGTNKMFKAPANYAAKKTGATANAEYTFVVDKNNPQRNDMTLPSSSIAQPNAHHKADWTILPTPGSGNDELELDSTMTYEINRCFSLSIAQTNELVFLGIYYTIRLMVTMESTTFVLIKIQITMTKMNREFLVGRKVRFEKNRVFLSVKLKQRFLSRSFLLH